MVTIDPGFEILIGLVGFRGKYQNASGRAIYMGYLILVYVVALGTTLLVGEGNLTYSKEILRQGVIHPKQLVATVFESEDLAYGRYAGMRSTTAALRKQGVTVLFGIDATSSLGSNTVLQQKLFKHIQFNYPHHVTAKSEDLEPNRKLLTGFFRQAIPLLEQNGLVRVLLNTNYPFGELKVAAGVNDGDAEEKVQVAAGVNDWMKGWNIEMCAKEAGLKLLKYKPFKFGDHILYKPTKGFGKDPSGEWQTGESLFYDLQVDWSKPKNANVSSKPSTIL
uniref:uncharacterized protein At4g26485-like n=1 Tax=Erigeron canadensis TaxID=72917 RepID=UPI001CB8D24C|nr:uncharacterized protein At4g26485-like [Erigeron canadensis]